MWYDLPSKISYEVLSDRCCKKISMLCDESRCKQLFNYLHYISTLFLLSFLISHIQMGKGLNPGVLKDSAEVILNAIYLYTAVKRKKTKHVSVQEPSFRFSGFDMEIQGWQFPKSSTTIFGRVWQRKKNFLIPPTPFFCLIVQNKVARQQLFPYIWIT